MKVSHHVQPAHKWTAKEFAKQSRKDNSVKLLRLYDKPVGFRLDYERQEESQEGVVASLAIEATLKKPNVIFPNTTRPAMPWQVTAVWGSVPELSDLQLPILYLASVPPEGHNLAKPEKNGPRPYTDTLFRGGELQIYIAEELSEPAKLFSLGTVLGIVVTEQNGTNHRIWDAQ